MQIWTLSVSLLVATGVAVMIGVALRRMGWLGKRDHTVTSGVANWLAGINEVMQPQIPTPEMVQRTLEQDDDDDDDGGSNDDDPAHGQSSRPSPRPRTHGRHT